MHNYVYIKKLKSSVYGLFDWLSISCQYHDQLSIATYIYTQKVYIAWVAILRGSYIWVAIYYVRMCMSHFMISAIILCNSYMLIQNIIT